MILFILIIVYVFVSYDSSSINMDNRIVSKWQLRKAFDILHV